ncbi:MAG TPA: ATP-binding cassette domain-containing protein [Microbacterium sp.]|uniref:branched-chain amino acid ABC transporter ATP-binding protein/permease n=1 Tax=Microbacterium sp. TaxID=51671 RepID=UPI002B492EB6|nr:ATP-binding cassette domain-containing protein [Microbacterium sp.]HKT58173.1 ATP-binding cassette domain-containing protein [Microbacterium sp.]
MRLDRGLKIAGMSAAVVILAILPIILDNYWLFLCSAATITAIIARGVGLVTNQAGMITLAQMSFVGAGAWIASWLNVVLPGVPFLLVILLAGVAVTPLGVAVGLPALRLRGVNLGVVTLAFAVAMTGILTAKGFPGQDTGQMLLTPVWASSPGEFYLFTLVTMLVVFVLLAILTRTRVGASWSAVRHSERATAALGVHVPVVKLTAFAVSAFLAGMAGAMLAFQLGTVSASAFGVVPSLVIFALAVFVGTQYPAGALLAGVLTVFFPELLSRLGIPQDIGNILFALGAIQALAAGRSVSEDVRHRVRMFMRARGWSTAPKVPAPIEPSNDDLVAPAEPGEVLLAIKDLTVRYGSVTALDHVTFDVRGGTVHGLIGPNGAGKSTLVDAVSGFLPRYEGDIRLGSRSLNGRAPHLRVRDGIRRSFQQGRAIPELTVGQYIALAARRRVSRTEIDELTAWLGCPGADNLIEEIDVGSRRLVEVAGALAAKPLVVVLDEPAAGLGEDESAALGRRLREIPGRFGIAVLLIEHDMDLVLTACSTVTVLDFGKVIGEGAPAEVLASAQVVSAYLGDDTIGGDTVGGEAASESDGVAQASLPAGRGARR